MKKFIAFAAIAAACSTSAFAQVSNFEGFSAATNLTYSNASVSSSSQKFKDKSAGANLQAAYGFALDANTVLSLGATYSLNNAKAGDYTNDDTTTGSLKLKKQISYYVEPGYLLNSSTLVYGKVSYDTATLNAIEAAGTYKFDVNGIGYGFGIRSMIDKNIFVQVEAKRTSFGKESFPGDTEQLKVKNTLSSVAIGYKF